MQKVVHLWRWFEECIYKSKACLYVHLLFTGGSIYCLMYSKENTDSLHVYCARLFSESTTAYFLLKPLLLSICSV